MTATHASSPTNAPRKPRKVARKQRRADRAAKAAQVMPPEGVPLHLPIAGVGVRLGAQITDVLITAGLAIALLVFLIATGIIGGAAAIAIGSLLFFAIRVPYYVAAELAWNGQTLGKRLMKIKVVAHDGGPLSTHALVLRNILKEAEVFLPGTLVLTLQDEPTIEGWIAFAWVMMALAIPLTNPYRMRLGDMLAGTHVVHLPVPILLSDMASADAAPRKADTEQFTFLPLHMDHYGQFELQTLEGFLRAQGPAQSPAAHVQSKRTAASIVDRIRKKIGYADAVEPGDHVAFLQAFYTAQRAHLEQRQLFGERRANKHESAQRQDDESPGV